MTFREDKGNETLKNIVKELKESIGVIDNIQQQQNLNDSITTTSMDVHKGGDAKHEVCCNCFVFNHLSYKRRVVKSTKTNQVENTSNDVLPHIQYGLQISGQNISRSLRVATLQRIAVRITTFSGCNASPKPVFSDKYLIDPSIRL